MKAWTEDTFSYEGKFWKFKDMAIWPRPYPAAASADLGAVLRQQGETIEWAARNNAHGG